MKKSKRITSRGALLVLDLEAVDRVWNVLPAKQVLEGLRAGTLVPRPPLSAPPAPSAEKRTKGLDVALAAFGMKRLLDRPLAENLRTKRALGFPWKWLSRAPDAKEEMRTDDRLLRWAEVCRVPDLTADEVLAISSAVEHEMIGAAEVKDAFARWGAPEFAANLDALAEGDVAAALDEAWDGDLAPLLAALGYDDEAALLAAVQARITEVRAALRFASVERYAVLPYLEERWGELLAGRAAARARA